MKPRHIYVAGKISDQIACRAAYFPTSRTGTWERAFCNAEMPAHPRKETKTNEPAPNPIRPGVRLMPELQILSGFHGPDFAQQEEPRGSIRVLTLQDLVLGEGWRVKELESIVRGGNRSMKALWVAGAVSVAIPLVYITFNAATISALETVMLLTISAASAVGLAAVGRHVKNTNLLAEQELQKAREELQATEANK